MSKHRMQKARQLLRAPQRTVGRPVEFHVKSSEWKKMPAKTKAALAEMIKCAAVIHVRFAQSDQKRKP